MEIVIGQFKPKGEGGAFLSCFIFCIVVRSVGVSFVHFRFVRINLFCLVYAGGRVNLDSKLRGVIYIFVRAAADVSHTHIFYIRNRELRFYMWTTNSVFIFLRICEASVSSVMVVG